jgi:hypothetical protein
MRAASAFVLPTWLMLAGASASAQPAAGAAGGAETTDAQAEAGESFEIGLRLLGEQNWSGALGAFERAYELAPHYAVLFNIGVCLKQLQRYPEALAAFERYLAEGGDQIRPEKRTEAEQAITDLRSFLSRVRIVVNVSGAEILVDGQSRGSSPLAEPLVLGAGHHVVEARAAGYGAGRMEFDLGGAGERDVTLELLSVDDGGPGPETGGEVGGPAWSDDWLGWTLGGTGLAAAAVGLGLVGAAVVKSSDADGEPDMTAANGMYDDAATLTLAGGIVAGVGGALLVTGIVLLAIPDSGETPPDADDGGSAVAWTPLLGPGGAGLLVAF